MMLHGTKFSFNGVSSTTGDLNFISNVQKIHHVSLPSLKLRNLVLGRSLGREGQHCLLPGQCINLQVGRSRRPPRVKSEDSESMLSSESITLDEETLEKELQNAITQENYAKAAEIRDTLKNLQKENDIKATVLMANSRFYDSFRFGSLAAMQAVWAKMDTVCCVHPGGKGISGYNDVIKSWYLLWANYEFPLDIKLEDIKVHVRGDVGYVTCMEFVKTKVGRWGGGKFVTNVFEKIDGQWFICIHHASPVDL